MSAPLLELRAEVSRIQASIPGPRRLNCLWVTDEGCDEGGARILHPADPMLPSLLRRAQPGLD